MATAAELRKSLKIAKRKYEARRAADRKLHSEMNKLRAKIDKRRRQLRDKSNPGARVVQNALADVGKTEVNNRAGWLDSWALKYVGPWMLGQPWCGLACIKWWATGAGKKIPTDTVSTVAILNRTRRGDGFQSIPFEQARPGDLVVMDFSPSPPEAMHVGLALGPGKNGQIATVEGNTSPSNGGSQNNGGGVYRRTRPRGVVRIVARPK